MLLILATLAAEIAFCNFESATMAAPLPRFTPHRVKDDAMFKYADFGWEVAPEITRAQPAK
ncbi:hypothetical protein [Sphingomonas kyeonggiensis]|uniref:Uncharacterized protein n=1 Tax=Sphingomonas kyeonggiensis TaxID=1268553 RepID=A0A7W6JNP5_9SPHN|nr:hypothetical protein [Sphingomonas kyeonggiensis]MBB4096738.1 hypothetical protein [Sphingomonas kyeonggiensis]